MLGTRRSFWARLASLAMATLIAWLPAVVHVPRARADEGEQPAAAAAGAESRAIRGDMPSVSRELGRGGVGSGGASLDDSRLAELGEDAVGDAEIDSVVEDAEIEASGEDAARAAREAEEAARTPISLPGGETRTAVNPQSISLPTAEGSIEGMGESFTPVLSSGTATFGVPIAVAPGRAGVQPSLSLSYSSSGGNGPVGFGWGIGAPFISRQTDRGLPLYDDRSRWHPNEDRFIYNGGQELVPVDNAAIGVVDDQADPEATVSVGTVPTELSGWQQYRARVEGGFMRFFRAPDSRRWVVQSPDGSRFDFGAIPAGQAAADADTGSSLEVDDEDGSRVFRWMISRSSDAHGSTIYYRYRRDRGQLYLSDISYVSPASCEGAATCSQPLSGYGARVRFVYEPREDAFTTYSSGYPVTTALRVRRIEVTAYDDETEQRTLVRRYHLRYLPGSFHSLLAEVQVEGRPSTTLTGTAISTAISWREGIRTILESSLGDAIVGDTLPPMRFRYSALPSGTSGTIAGFGGLSTTVVDIAGSPPNSIDEARAELMDVNSDGLPDLVVTDPARYRTRDGQPGAGVFFNGFSGSDVRPGSAGSFSAAVPLAIPSGLDAVMAFSNLNIVPMDIDGDGRQDLLHMPRTRTYGWFTPVRTAAESISPRDQGWRFAYAEIDLPTSDLDPRVDFGRDGQHLEVLDVNNDHLIDVVRTTGTVMQTWLNLGWLPGGDGRFGSYTVSGTSAITSSSVSLSTAPYESCLLQSGTPVDFESSEVRLADMNGDGLQDVVEIQRGRIRYWPGRGVGSFGVGSRRCARGEGANRYVEVSSPPRDLPIDLAGVQLADIDGDGATDILAVRFDAIDVWFNRAGSSFAERLILRGTPPATGFANRVRFTDIDGSGTIDAVYGTGAGWQFVNLLADASGNALRPRLLVGVENGLGAETTLSYESSAVDYLRDLSQASTCGASCESFAWQGSNGSEGSRRLAALTGEPASSLLRPGGTPVISTVVRSVQTTDHLERVGGTAQSSESRFAYHDGYYEGIEQEFRGFGAADAVVVGDDPSADVLTRTWFQQGRRPANIADDRLAWSPDEALKGREFLTEVFNRAGTFLTTSHASLTTRLLATGLDGRPIQYAFVSEMNEIRYDTSPFTASANSLSLPSVRREVVNATTGAPAAASPAADPPRTVGLRGAARARLRTTYDSVDNLGHVRAQTVYGHVADSGWVGPTDEPVTSVSSPLAVNPADGLWLWRTRRQWAHGTDDTFHFGDTETVFDEDTGDPLHVYTRVTHPSGMPEYVFGGDPTDEGGATGAFSAAQNMASSSEFDAWGNVTATWSGAGGATAGGPAQELRRRDVVYDGTYAHFPVSETLEATSTVDLVTQVPMPTGGGGVDVGTSSAPGWDRGLGAILYATDPNGQRTSMTQDGLGRVTSMTPPLTSACGAGETAVTPLPATVISYQVTTDGRSQPMSTVRTVQVLHTTECDFTSLGTELSTSEAMGFVDGLGRVRATLAQGDRSAGGSQHWIRSGLADLDRKGQVVTAYHPSFVADTVTSFGAILTPGSEELTSSSYDSFGRAVVTTDENGGYTTSSYHAASITVCDPLDNSTGNLHSGTCTTSRSDGFGRVIDQILIRSVEPGSSDDEYHRLWSYYRADGAVTSLVRARTDDQNPRPALGSLPTLHVRRDFFYDSVGRRLGSNDPDTDDPNAASAGTATWRYRFNVLGDLVAVRDPRGCGQNFFYDRGGRLLGEQYVACDEAPSTIGEQPIAQITGAIFEIAAPSSGGGGGPECPGGCQIITTTGGGVTAWVDVAYRYDAYPAWFTYTYGTIPETAAGVLGRATGVEDRGQRSVVAYDERGSAIWTARQMAVIPIANRLASSPGSGFYPDVTETDPYEADVSYDTAHTYFQSSDYDFAGRGRRLYLPVDPDFSGGGPVISGELSLDSRGLPIAASAFVDEEEIEVLSLVEYEEHGLVTAREYGPSGTPVLLETFTHDVMNRPITHEAVRASTSGTTAGEIGYVTSVADETLDWDPASNLIGVDDHRVASQWPAFHRVRDTTITHDSLYRIASVGYEYTQSSGTGPDLARDWRNDATPATHDPMHPEAAPHVGGLPEERVNQLDYDWDWLGNEVSRLDDAYSFYERSLGTLTSGNDEHADVPRPSALYLATNIDDMGGVESTWDGAGWVEVQYGDGGNVLSFTVHGECHDVSSGSCEDDLESSIEDRIDDLRELCTCAVEQHYSYAWDELNRLVDARRYDRPGTGAWVRAARLRHRYDGANQRAIKEVMSPPTTGGGGGVFGTGGGGGDGWTTSERVSLFVYPGDFERRGLTRTWSTYSAVTTGEDATETQYLVAGARIVWDAEEDYEEIDLDRNRRATINVTDLLGTTGAVIDLLSGDLLEVSTYYPNGARENLWTNDALLPQEPMGFTTKEADEEVGVTYFGERWLIPRLGRWATPDPLHIHAAGGGEVLNSYHYVTGNSLQARDPLGLDDVDAAARAQTRGFYNAAPTTSQIRALASTVRHFGFARTLHDMASLPPSWGPTRITEGTGRFYGWHLGPGVSRGTGVRSELDDGTAGQITHFLSAVSVGVYHREWIGVGPGPAALAAAAGHESPEAAGGTGFDALWEGSGPPAHVMDAAAAYAMTATIDGTFKFSQLDAILEPLYTEWDLPERSTDESRGASRADLRLTALGIAYGHLATNGVLATPEEQAAWLEHWVAAPSETASSGSPATAPASPSRSDAATDGSPSGAPQCEEPDDGP